MVTRNSFMRLLRGLGSQLLPCGCLAGVYETYAGETVAIIDAHGEQCEDATHRVGEQAKVEGLPAAGQLTDSSNVSAG
jgi:hypothetical protein